MQTLKFARSKPASQIGIVCVPLQSSSILTDMYLGCIYVARSQRRTTELALLNTNSVADIARPEVTFQLPIHSYTSVLLGKAREMTRRKKERKKEKPERGRKTERESK